MLSWILGTAWPFLLGLVAVVAVWFTGRHSGQSAADSKRVQQRIDAIGKAREVEDEVSDLGDDDLRRRARQWVRDDER